MSVFFSKTTGGFYDSSINGDNMPEDVTPESAWTLTHQELLNGQAGGKIITSDDAGNPMLSDPPAPTENQLAVAIRSKRDRLIMDTDYLLMPDYPISDEKLIAIKEYRQLLRDVTEQSGFPTEINWPVNPLGV